MKGTYKIIFLIVIILFSCIFGAYFYVKKTNSKNGEAKHSIDHGSEVRKSKLKNVYVEVPITHDRLALDKQKLIGEILIGSTTIKAKRKNRLYFCTPKGQPAPWHYLVKLKNKEDKQIKGLIKKEFINLWESLPKEHKNNKNSLIELPLQIIFNVSVTKVGNIEQLDLSKLPSNWNELYEYSQAYNKRYYKSRPNESSSCPSLDNAYKMTKEKLDSLPYKLKNIDIKKHAKPVTKE